MSVAKFTVAESSKAAENMRQGFVDQMNHWVSGLEENVILDSDNFGRSAVAQFNALVQNTDFKRLTSKDQNGLRNLVVDGSNQLVVRRKKQLFDDALNSHGDWFVDVPNGGPFLYRNMNDKVRPAMVLQQGMWRGRYEMTDYKGTLRSIFKARENAFTVIDTYVRRNELVIDGVRREDFPCMSTTTEPNNTLGENPTWQYAIEKPNLRTISADIIARDLGVSLAQVNALQGRAVTWTLQSDNGLIDGANIIAFVGTEVLCFLPILLEGRVAAFRRYGTYNGDQAYRSRWKVLSETVAKGYFDLTFKFGQGE